MSKTKVIEVFERTQMIVQIGTDTKGRVTTVTVSVDELETLNSDYINEHFGDLQDTAYQRGFEKGKDVRIKGCEGCMYQDTTIEHNPCNLCCNAFLNRWTAKDDKIEVGDEVYCKGDYESDSGVVTWAGKDGVYAMWQDGSAGEVQKDELIKTGRHFDIKSILEAMKA